MPAQIYLSQVNGLLHSLATAPWFGTIPDGQKQETNMSGIILNLNIQIVAEAIGPNAAGGSC
jgi:hypothetical protein